MLSFNPTFTTLVLVALAKLQSQVAYCSISKNPRVYFLEYEKRTGRKPEDVSKENTGFDVKSVDEEGNIRYIEVKGRASIGSIALTQNEWFKAQRLGENYYLYVVWNAKNELNAEFIAIKNPALNLSVQEKEVVRYIITSEETMKKGNK